MTKLLVCIDDKCNDLIQGPFSEEDEYNGDEGYVRPSAELLQAIPHIQTRPSTKQLDCDADYMVVDCNLLVPKNERDECLLRQYVESYKEVERTTYPNQIISELGECSADGEFSCFVDGGKKGVVVRCFTTWNGEIGLEVLSRRIDENS